MGKQQNKLNKLPIVWRDNIFDFSIIQKCNNSDELLVVRSKMINSGILKGS